METSETVRSLHEVVTNQTESNHFIKPSFYVEVIMCLGLL